VRASLVALTAGPKKRARFSFFPCFPDDFLSFSLCLLVAHSVHCVAYIVYRNFQFPALLRALGASFLLCAQRA
jgi:hypothetical protein